MTVYGVIDLAIVAGRQYMPHFLTHAALGYFHALSRRSEVYVVYGRIDNRHGAAYTVGTAIEAGTGNRAANVGLRHTF